MAKGPFMEYLRARVTMTAANTYTEVILQTPTSKTENMAMLIHTIEFEPARLIDSTPEDQAEMRMQVCKNPQDDSVQISNSDQLANWKTRFHLAAVTNWLTSKGANIHKFSPPILYPKSQIYFGMGTLSFISANLGHVKIGYTLEKVSREDFISALVE